MTSLPPPAVHPRPAFRDGQVLRATDLGDESEAITGAERRHVEVAHLPGIVGGLWLSPTSVSPGMAVDALGRTILVASTVSFPEPSSKCDVWIAYRERESRAHRVEEAFEVLIETSGLYPPGGHPAQAIFLGTIVDKRSNPVGRVYVGAVGVRIESPSRQARMLLGPEDPGDVRLFASGTPTADGEIRDHLALESTDAIRFHDRVRLAAAKWDGKSDAIAHLCLGRRPVPFLVCDILDPIGLAAAMGLPGTDVHHILRSLNRLIDEATFDELAKRLEDRRPGLETLQLQAYHQANSPRHNPPRLARRLLEDAYAPYLKPLNEISHPLGVGFVGPRPLPTEALPGSVSLVSADVAGTRRELRFEIPYPGKENSPEYFQFAVGTSTGGPAASKKKPFRPILTVAADGSVTIDGDLRVLAEPGSGSPGLVLVVDKPAAADDPPGKPSGVGAVSPFDLAIKDVKVIRVKEKLTLTRGRLFNSGAATLTDVQLFATVFATTDTTLDPETTPLFRGQTIAAKGELQLIDPDEPKLTPRLEITIQEPKLALLPNVMLVLSAYGLGPGFTPISVQRKILVP